MGNAYNIVAEAPESTVVAEFTPAKIRSDSYQSEADLEKAFIRQLTEQGYEYLPIHSEAELIANLRRQLEALNDYTFSDREWTSLFRTQLASEKLGIEEKTSLIQEKGVLSIRCDNGLTKNITLFDRRNVHNNRLQVINQYVETGGTHETRYDVTILVNGFPLVHVELKRRGVAIREAFNQINRYQRDSFWASSGLYQYVEIFVISNGTHTKYYSNTTRDAHVRELTASGKRKSKKTSNSFEFTSYWADASSNIIADLVDFTSTFFCKHTLLNILARFCVFTSEKLLLVMRPYQITATERILQKIEVAHNYKKAGTIDGGGYVWHTTGSGKTLTSFKTAQLATRLPYIDKVLFVVDRKDLDYQTIREYDRFQKGAANGNTSVKILTEQLGNPETRIIITTIQKLGIFIKRNPKHEVYSKNIVMIFDECHRSQFGDMHAAIVKAFRKYYLFGFTGTPIFAQNTGSGNSLFQQTTEQTFGVRLHSYTIVNAINDGNVLPFRIDYINTFREADNIRDERISRIDTDRILNAPQRISNIVTYTLDHFDQKTKRSSFYTLKDKRVAGFNSLFAVSSIPAAILYYKEFKKQLAERKSSLTIATIFSYNPNEDDPDDSFDTAGLDTSSRDFLDSVIADYNRAFNTNFDTSADKFQNYYKDLSMRMKNRDIDLLIVVNMFLTGFDATTLNTLWVDKNLKYHGLIQAFSRTNRILNSVKTFGNIVCFRDLQKETDEAIALFGNKDAGGIVILKPFDDYYNGFDEEKPDGSVRHVPGYAELVADMQTSFPLGSEFLGEEKEKEFIALFGSILRVRNILSAFDAFAGKEILTPREFQDYQSVYLDLYQKHRTTRQGDKEDVSSDIVFEMELMRQVEINIDYILMLVEKYKASQGEDKTILASIATAVNSSIELRSKKELIEGFVANLNMSSASVTEDWKSYVAERKEEDLAALIEQEGLRPEETRHFLEHAFRDGEFRTGGPELQNLMPRRSLFDDDNDARTNSIIDKIKLFFERYLGLSL